MFLKINLTLFTLFLPFHSCLCMNLKSQEELDQFVGSRSVELYKKLNECSRYRNPETKERLHIPGNVWEIAGPQEGITLCKVNKNIKASLALDKIFENEENLLDCMLASNIVMAQCLSKIFGNTFDDFYQYVEEKSGSQVLLAEFITLFCDQLKTATLKDCTRSGGSVAFRNFPNYSQLNPKGSYSNDCVQIVYDKTSKSIKYMGFGKMYQNGPLSYDEVKKCFLMAYNVDLNKKSIAYKILSVDTIVEQMGFQKGGKFESPSFDHPPAQAVKEYIQEKTHHLPQFFSYDFLQETVFDFIQICPIFILSFEKIKSAVDWVKREREFATLSTLPYL